MSQLICGDAREVLVGMAENSVHACITSPPYWGLRDYGCPEVDFADGWRGQFGLEPTPEMYVEHTIEFLRAIRRVLRDDGTCWWVIGDSYAGAGDRRGGKGDEHGQGKKWATPAESIGLKPKDLVMIPFRVALAAQADGWWVRSVVIWSKPNPMPESVRDRPTTAHEYVLLLTKSKTYYYDADAIREQGTSGASDLRKMEEKRQRIGGKNKDADDPFLKASAATNIGRKRAVGNPQRNKRTVWEIATQPFKGPHYATFPPKLVEPMILTTPTKVCAECGAGYARVVQKPDMSDRPLRATAKQDGKRIHSGFDGYPQSAGQAWQNWRNENPDVTLGFRPTCSCGKEVVCDRCGGTGIDPEVKPEMACYDCLGGGYLIEPSQKTPPATILDPFCGTGTTCLTAAGLGRDWIGIDIDPKSIEMAKERLGLFAMEAADA